NALEEGAKFLFLTNPVAVEGESFSGVKAVLCVRMELAEPDKSGRRKPRAVKGSEFSISADVVLVAYGFDPVPFSKDSDLSTIAINEWGGVVIDSNQMTSVRGVFSGGDATLGPSLVVHAVRDGRKAARAICNYLRLGPPG